MGHGPGAGRGGPGMKHQGPGAGRGGMWSNPAAAVEGHRGHPVVFDASLLPELLAISEDTEGVRAVMRGHAAQVQDVETGDPAATLDLNTAADLRRSKNM